MPDLPEDIARQVNEISSRLVPTEGETGHFLAVTAQSPFGYAFRQGPDDEIPRYPGPPDGVLAAPIDSLVRNTDDHTVWINTDGDTAWSPVGGGDGTDTYVAASVSGAIDVDFAVARVHKLTMTGNITPTFIGAVAGAAYGLTLYLVQDGTGSRLVTWPAAVNWPSNQAPILSIAANAIDIVVMESFDGGTSWFANLAGRSYA